MEQADAIGVVEPVPAWDEVEWHRQMRFASSTAYPVQQPKGKLLWLTCRRALAIVIAAFDAHYGIEPKKVYTEDQSGKRSGNRSAPGARIQ